jgi:hypothetical protein
VKQATEVGYQNSAARLLGSTKLVLGRTLENFVKQTRSWRVVTNRNCNFFGLVLAPSWAFDLNRILFGGNYPAYPVDKAGVNAS